MKFPLPKLDEDEDWISESLSSRSDRKEDKSIDFPATSNIIINLKVPKSKPRHLSSTPILIKYRFFKEEIADTQFYSVDKSAQTAKTQK